VTGVKKTLVPKLRFPEFREAGEWKEQTFSNIAKIVMGASPKSDTYNQTGEGLPLLQGNADIKSRLSAPRVFASQITKECLPGDILLSVRAPVGTVAKSVHHACIGRGIAAIRSKKHSQEFIYQWLLFFESQWHHLSQGGTFDAVNGDDIRQLSITLPLADEQQKIADCLSSLDALITAQAEKIDALKTHKKGLMQQLFPREGETVPRLRFPEFRDAEEWNVGTIGDVADVSSGGTPNRSEAEYWNGDIPWVSTSLIDFGTIEFANEYITREGLDNSSAKIVPNGTVLMAMYGQGKTRGKVAILGIDAAINQACSAISAKDVVLSEFVFQNLSGRYDEIRKISNPGGQENLSGALIKDISFKFPSIESGEQKKITDCLSSLDSIIAAHSEKLDALKTHKKGLMQQLFPSPEAFGV